MSISSNDIINKKFSDAINSVELYIDNLVQRDVNLLLKQGFLRVYEADLNKHIFHINHNRYGRKLPKLIRAELIDELIKRYPDWDIKQETMIDYNIGMDEEEELDYILAFYPRKKFEKTTELETKIDEGITNRADILDLGNSDSDSSIK